MLPTEWTSGSTEEKQLLDLQTNKAIRKNSE